MEQQADIVISGLGVVSPIGVGNDAFWASLCAGRSGIRQAVGSGESFPGALWGTVADFDPKLYVRPRKSLKVMSRDIQLGFAAADLACQNARIDSQPVAPERMGVMFGADMIMCELGELVAAFRACMVDGRFDFALWGEKALPQMYPLWMLKYLPNMPACHIGIAQDARGPTNSVVLGETSSLAALAEAVRVLARGAADAMIVGGTSSRFPLATWLARHVVENSSRVSEPERACRPFDAQRDGTVCGEGAAALIVETLASAKRRGAPVLARVLGHSMTFARRDPQSPDGSAIRRAIEQALHAAGVRPDEIDHVNAHGAGTRLDDRLEAQAIRCALGDVPVTAPKSFFGSLGAASGAVELAASVLGFQHGLVPYTLNYEQPDPECPVCVVREAPAPLTRRAALMLNHSPCGQAAAVVIARPESPSLP